jgi:hypothetical protein
MGSAENWFYYGTWRSPQAFHSPYQGRGPWIQHMSMAGWVDSDGTAWNVQIGDVRLQLLVHSDESHFLNECIHTHQLRCWASGPVVATRRSKVMVPDDLSIFRIAQRFEFPPAPSPFLAEMLAHNQHMWVLSQTLHSIVQGDWSSRRVVHPLALVAYPESLLQDGQDAIIGFVFAAHMQAETASGTCKFLGDRCTRLGSSGWAYDHGKQQLCGVLPARRDICVPRGCLIVSKHATALLRAARGCCHQSRGPLLVIAPREMVPALAAALTGLHPLVALCERALPQQPGGCLVVPSELARKSLALLRRTMWWRVLLCDWPRIAEVLSPCLSSAEHRRSWTLLRCELQVTLLLAADAVAQPERIVGREQLALLLGTPSDLLGCPSATRDLLTDRTLRLYAEQETPHVRQYGLVRLPAPSDEEHEDGGAHIGYHASLSVLLGSLVNAGRRRLRRLPKDTSVPEYFRGNGTLSNYEASSFAREQSHCAVCLSEEESAEAVTRCGHWFCSRCIDKVLAAGYRTCPICRRTMNARTDIVLCREHVQLTTFLRNLSAFLQTPEIARHKIILVTSFASCLERVALALRQTGVAALAWSGNAQQLMHTFQNFETWQAGCLLCDPIFLTLRWTRFSNVTRLCCVLPLNTDCKDACCQLHSVLDTTPTSALTVIGCQPVNPLPETSGECGCPFFICTG